MVDIALIVFACIVPVLLSGFNLIVLARYIDPQAAAGHFIAKIMIVSAATMRRRRARARTAGWAAPLPVAPSARDADRAACGGGCRACRATRCRTC